MENKEKVLATFTVTICKDLGTLAKFAGKKNVRYNLKSVCLDLKKSHVVASDGHSMQIKPIACDSWDENLGKYYPLVEARVWEKMCYLAGPGEKLTCMLIGNSLDNLQKCIWHCECNREVSIVPAMIFPDYIAVIPLISRDNILRLDKKTWSAVKKWFSENKEIGRLLIEHKENSSNIVFKIPILDNPIREEDYHIAEFPCDCVPKESFYIFTNGLALTTHVKNFNLYLPPHPNSPMVFIGEKELILEMPLFLSDRYQKPGYSLTNYSVDAFIEAGLREEEVPNINRLEEKVSNDQRESPKRTRGRKFTFAAVGINTGDTLTFVDGTEVIAAENTTVVFRDESFTLSGFCKKFMPERMRTKSNSYRGCAFFYKDGMKLGTMFKNALSNTPISESEPDKRQDETKTVQLPRAELQTTKTELQRKSETLHPQLAPAGIINPPCDNIDTLEEGKE